MSPISNLLVYNKNTNLITVLSSSVLSSDIIHLVTFLSPTPIHHINGPES